MRMIALFAAATVAMTGVASADGDSDAVKEWYFSTYGGANWGGIDDGFGPVTISPDTGYVVGVTAGKKVAAVPGLRVEADVNYRSNDLSVAPIPGLQLEDETWSVMGNVAYDFMHDTPIRPYVLAGAGVANRVVSVETIPLTVLQIESTGFAWQVGTGVNADVAEGVAVGLGYRYFNGPDFSIGPVSDNGSNHAVIGQVTFDF